MQTNRMTRAVGAGLVLAAAAGTSHAVNLSQNGMGQVLVYPYYTVNAGQQTLLTVANTGDAGKALKVRFLEAYNGREVLEFTVFLSPRDVWTAPVFKLSDAGLPGAGAGIFTTDNSCIAPLFPQGPLANGYRYQAFLDYAYTGANSDTGPTDDVRTSEGHFEIIAMADIVAGSALDADTRQVNGVPPGCARAEADFETGDGTVAPTGGLFGSASIVDVAQGTIFAYNAEALDGFTYVKLNSPLASGKPDLASANDPGGAPTVTARAFLDGAAVTSVFPAARAIDAVSAVFMTDYLYDEYVASVDGSIGTDWVVTFPTKRFYVDAALQPSQVKPFEHLFGARESGNDLGVSCVVTDFHVFDRDEGSTGSMPCGFCPCPPGGTVPQLCLETSVVQFSSVGVLGSELKNPLVLKPLSQGMAQLDMGDYAHDMNAANNGNTFHGLPLVGFAATRYINGSLPASGGVSALANYTAAYRLRGSTTCSNANGPCS